MGVQLRFIGQAAMDSYYKEFKGNTGFFELGDFIFRAGAVVADYYQKLYEQKYQELRQEKSSKDELVGVDQDLLSVQVLTVEKEEAEIKYPVMSFSYDKSNTGYQYLMAPGAKLERASISEVWQFDYLPKTNRIFWYAQNGKIKFYTSGICKVGEVELFYIPSVINNEGKVFGEAMIPDGVAHTAIAATVSTMKQIEAQTVIKKALDNNGNAILETEINKEAVK